VLSCRGGTASRQGASNEGTDGADERRRRKKVTREISVAACVLFFCSTSRRDGRTQSQNVTLFLLSEPVLLRPFFVFLVVVVVVVAVQFHFSFFLLIFRSRVLRMA